MKAHGTPYRDPGRNSAHDSVTTARVLLIEANPAYAKPLRQALATAAGTAVHVAWAADRTDALKQLKATNFDLVLLDIELPGSQGLALFEHIVQAAPQALILILTSSADEQTARQAVQLGAHDYLSRKLISSPAERRWLARTLSYLLEGKRTRQALQVSEARFRAISDASPLGIFVADGAGDCLYTNAAYQAISGLTFEQTLGTNWSCAIHPDDRETVLALWRKTVIEHAPFNIDVRFVRGDDSLVWTRINSAPMGSGPMPGGHIQTVEDITARKHAEMCLQHAEEALFAEKERAQVTLNSIGDAVLATDLDGNVTYLNLVAETMTGWPCREATGRPLHEVLTLIDGTTGETAENPAERAIAEDKIVGMAMNSVLVRRDGATAAIEDSAAPIHNRDGQVSGAVIVFHDVSQSVEMARKMSHLAQHDSLTGLANRSLLTEHFTQAAGLAKRHQKQIALLFLDVDNFKTINDSLGHATGDRVLKSIAARISACVRSTDTVCRQGGDEFVVLLAEIESPQDAAQVAKTLRGAVTSTHFIDGRELHITMSIGIGIYPADGDTLDGVLQAADTAMYYAKASGRNNSQFFKPEMTSVAVRRLHLESCLHRALREQEFLLHYQPKIDLASDAVVGAEALIRWRDPQQGLMYPRDFIAAAEACGLIVPIGRWVLQHACEQYCAWLDRGLPVVSLSVNISALEFKHRDFLSEVSRILQVTRMPPNHLELELTESVLMDDAESSAAVLTALKALGVRLAVDDFGTGYSSLSYLKRFPIDTLKIDQSFVRDITTDADDAAIVIAVIGMGRNLKHHTVAEGVETPEQFAFLKAQHCEQAQGFQIARPLAAGDFVSWLRHHLQSLTEPA